MKEKRHNQVTEGGQMLKVSEVRSSCELMMDSWDCFFTRISQILHKNFNLLERSLKDESRVPLFSFGWVCRQELTFRPSESRHLGGELLGRRSRPLRPRGAPVRHLRAALPTNSGGVPEGQDVLDEEGSERFDGVRHLRRGNPQTGRLSLADSYCRRRG